MVIMADHKKWKELLEKAEVAYARGDYAEVDRLMDEVDVIIAKEDMELGRPVFTTKDFAISVIKARAN
jgi:hypothetical protein